MTSFKTNLKLIFALVLIFMTNNISAQNINIIAYPNPYDSSSKGRITFKKKSGGASGIDFKGEVRVIIYNATLKTIFEKVVAEGNDVTWRAIDNAGEIVPPGLYYIRLLENRNDGHSVSDFFKLIIR